MHLPIQSRYSIFVSILADCICMTNGVGIPAYIVVHDHVIGHNRPRWKFNRIAWKTINYSARTVRGQCENQSLRIVVLSLDEPLRYYVLSVWSVQERRLPHRLIVTIKCIVSVPRNEVLRHITGFLVTVFDRSFELSVGNSIRLFGRSRLRLIRIWIFR